MSIAKSLIAALVLAGTALSFNAPPASASETAAQTDWAAAARASGADPTLDALIRRRHLCFYRHGPRGPGYYPCRRKAFLYPYFHRSFYYRHGRRLGLRPAIRRHVTGIHRGALSHQHMLRRAGVIRGAAGRRASVFGGAHVDRRAAQVRPYRERLGAASSFGTRTRAFRQERFGGANGVVQRPGVTPGPRIGAGQGVPVGAPRGLGANFRGNPGGMNMGGGVRSGFSGAGAARIGGGGAIGGGGHIGAGGGGGRIGGGGGGGGGHIGGGGFGGGGGHGLH